MTLVREFNLYLNAGKSIPLVINVNQYDYGEQWVFTLYSDNGTQYTPSSGAIVGIKSDNLGIINTATVDGQGRVVVNETQQMTAAVGKATFELLIDGQTHGTANFFVLVEPKPGDNADLSESDYSLFQEAINGTSATAIAEGVSDWMDENLTPTTPVVDASLTVSGAAADAKKAGDEISELKSQISGGLTDDIKDALLAMFEYVGYEGTEGQTLYNNLQNALYPPPELVSISAVYTQSGSVYTTDTLDDLRDDLVVTALYDDQSTETVTDYTLSGTLTQGTSTITVAYEGKTTTFTVTVTERVRYVLTTDDITYDARLLNCQPQTYSGRACYAGFAVQVEPEKTYNISITATGLQTSGTGLVALNGSAVTRVQGGSAAVSGTFVDNGWTANNFAYTTPALINNEPPAALMFNYRGTNISITEVVIEEA